jgi:hypothetical protein
MLAEQLSEMGLSAGVDYKLQNAIANGLGRTPLFLGRNMLSCGHGR